VRIRELRPFTILAIGWGLGLVYAYPGVMTLDGNDQLQQARDNFFTDSHPPAMAFLWRHVDHVIAGPFGMLVLQTAAFLAGLFLILRRTLAPRRAAVATVIVFLIPPVLSPLAAVWKDCMMAGALLLGIALLLEQRPRPALAGLGCLVLATALRYNALAATLPLVVLLFVWKWDAGWRRYALAAAAWLVVTATAFGINGLLTDQQMYLWQSSLAVFDIAGTIAHVDEPLSDDELRTALAGTEILVDHDIQAAVRARYVPYDFDGLLTEGGLWKLPLLGRTPAPEGQRDAIGRAFWDLAGAHPGAYLRHRLACFAEVLGIERHSPAMMVRGHRQQFANEMQKENLGWGWSRAQDRLEHTVAWMAKYTPFFHPWIYLAVSLILLPLAWRQRDVLAVLLSGLAMEGSLFLLAAAPDYRYSHWMVVCTALAVVVLTARRARPPEQA
jgi:hypothetical protein